MKNDMSDFWCGLGVMCALLGIGGCDYLRDKGEAELLKAKHQIRIQESVNATTNKVEKGP